MDRIRLHYSKFCGLARHDEFRAWLRTTSPDLADFLGQTSPVGGCKARAERMLTVYNKLYDAGKGSELETLIKSRFPYVIDQSAVKPELNARKHLNVSKSPPPPPIPRIDPKALDPNGVFKLYRPEILTFPQKRILTNADPTQLQAQVAYFVKDKFGVETLIIGDRAYIEYFEPRYKDVADKIPQHQREIHQYRQRTNANSPGS